MYSTTFESLEMNCLVQDRVTKLAKLSKKAAGKVDQTTRALSQKVDQSTRTLLKEIEEKKRSIAASPQGVQTTSLLEDEQEAEYHYMPPGDDQPHEVLL